MAFDSRARFLNLLDQGRQARQAHSGCPQRDISEEREDTVADLRNDPLAGCSSFDSALARSSAILRSVLDAEPIKIPEGLVCKNTFFDIPEHCDMIKERPHTWGPPASRVTVGWHLSSSLLSELSEAGSPSLVMPNEEHSLASVSDEEDQVPAVPEMSSWLGEAMNSLIAGAPGLQCSPTPAFYGDTPTPTGTCFKGSDAWQAPLGSSFADLLAEAVGAEGSPAQEPLGHGAQGADQDGCNQLGSEELPTYGSKNHHLGTCKPCAFFHKGGCNSGKDCVFCHLCPPGEKKRRKKVVNFRKRIGRNVNEQEVEYQIYCESDHILPSVIPDTLEPRAEAHECLPPLQTLDVSRLLPTTSCLAVLQSPLEYQAQCHDQTLDVPCLPAQTSCPTVLEYQLQYQTHNYDPDRFQHAQPQQSFADSWPRPCQPLQPSLAGHRVQLDLHRELGLDCREEEGQSQACDHRQHTGKQTEVTLHTATQSTSQSLKLPDVPPVQSRPLTQEVTEESISADLPPASKDSLNSESYTSTQGNRDSHSDRGSKKGSATSTKQAPREQRQQEGSSNHAQPAAKAKARAAEERERLRREVLRLSAQLEVESLADQQLEGVASRSFRSGAQIR